MAKYIKANGKVAEYLNLTKDRNKTADGNYLLWQADMLAFGKLTELPQIMERIGGMVLQAHEAREEQDGTVSRKLPTATDSQFAVEETQETQETEQETQETQETEQETQGGTEEAGTAADGTEAGASGGEEAINDNSETETEAQP